MTVDDTRTYFEPLRKSVTVELPPEDAFELFTSRMESWWPIAVHSISQERAVGLVLEPGVGGRLFEVRDDGETFPWGAVTAWEPPTRVVFSWHPGQTPDSAQEVEVRFRKGQDGTLVELEHRGWAKLGKEAREVRRDYAAGWDEVLGQSYLDACNSLSA